MTLFQHHLLALGIVSATTFGLGVFVLWKNPKRNLHRSMALYCFSLAWWSGWECAALQMPTHALTKQLMRIEYMGVSFIATLFCTAVSFLLDWSPRVRRRVLLPLYLGSAVALIAASVYPTTYFLDVTPGPVAYLPIWGLAGPFYWIFLVFFLGELSAGLGLTFFAWRRAEGQERTRLALFLVGSLVAYVGACPEFALKYGIRLGWLNPFGLYGMPFYIGLMTYAIVQHRFLDIHVVIRRSVVYSLLVTLLTVGYFGLIYAVERLFQTTFGYHSVGVSVAAFALMALAFQPLKIGIQRLVDWLLFRAPHEELVKRMERFEQEALKAEKLKAISTLAAGMAHEIKNPLTAIKTFTEFLEE
ncbi:MAG: histidine kinase N-terminal 7TM domain-containing protein, partial [Candidatus Omnitrophota bacterium]|nr:histidine kinase N-terminal 7TM domain-containing protein [Candidatus Omnitrophota bacterium]